MEQEKQEAHLVKQRREKQRQVEAFNEAPRGELGTRRSALELRGARGRVSCVFLFRCFFFPPVFCLVVQRYFPGWLYVLIFSGLEVLFEGFPFWTKHGGLWWGLWMSVL